MGRQDQHVAAGTGLIVPAESRPCSRRSQSGFLLDVPVNSLLPREVRWHEVLPAQAE